MKSHFPLESPESVITSESIGSACPMGPVPAPDPLPLLTHCVSYWDHLLPIHVPQVQATGDSHTHLPAQTSPHPTLSTLQLDPPSYSISLGIGPFQIPPPGHHRSQILPSLPQQQPCSIPLLSCRSKPVLGEICESWPSFEATAYLSNSPYFITLCCLPLPDSPMILLASTALFK